MDDWRSDRIGSAQRGENPTVMAKLPSAFAVMGDVQWLPGYCVLLVDRPGVGALTDLGPVERVEFLTSMAALGEAVESACRAADDRFRRLNFDILGNADEFLRAHVWPRYHWEPAERVAKPVWLYPAEFWTLPSVRLGPQHDQLRAAVTADLIRLGASAVDHRPVEPS
jgi:diadenosine tetraphosphate (Ap4A) HIT family hydrolase